MQDLLKQISSQFLLVHSQQWKHQNNMWNLFKVSNEDTRTSPTTSSITSNIFHTFFYCFYCLHWTGQCLLCTLVWSTWYFCLKYNKYSYINQEIQFIRDLFSRILTKVDSNHMKHKESRFLLLLFTKSICFIVLDYRQLRLTIHNIICKLLYLFSTLYLLKERCFYNFLNL